MNRRLTTIVLIAHGLLAITSRPGISVGEVSVLSAVGMRQVMLDLAPKFERATGHSISIRFDSSGVIARRVAAADGADVVLINQAGVDRLSKARAIVEQPATPLAIARVGVAVRGGAAKPDISTPDTFKRAMLAATSVAWPDPALEGSSGPHIAAVFRRLGIAGAMQSKTIFADPPGPNAATPGSLVSMGRADVAVHQIQELVAVKGIALVGPLPDDLQQTFTFFAAITRTARDVAAAREFIAFLQTPQSREVIVAKGMDVAKD